MKKKHFLAAGIGAAAAVAAAGGLLTLGKNSGSYYEPDGRYTKVKAGDSFGYVENHPAFAEFKDFIQPWKDPWNRIVTPHQSVRFISRLNHLDPSSVTDGFNFVIGEAQDRQIFYDIYTEEEREADPSKKETGLIVIPGDPEKPVALLAAGGAFQSVCLFIESFPTGKILHEMGYNIVILKYRVAPNEKTYQESEAKVFPKANEDLCRALQFCFEHEEELGFRMENYSVWGFSAGGRTVWSLGLDNQYGYQAHGLKAPAAMILVYSGWYDPAFAGEYGTVPPTYFAWLPEDDVIGKENVEGIRLYMKELERLGIPYREDAYYNAHHGFGEGRGTSAEGWISHAVSFWEEQIR